MIRDLIEGTWDNLGAVIMALAFACIPLAILLSALGIENPLTDLVAGLMGAEACSTGSFRPGWCGGP